MYTVSIRVVEEGLQYHSYYCRRDLSVDGSWNFSVSGPFLRWIVTSVSLSPFPSMDRSTVSTSEGFRLMGILGRVDVRSRVWAKETAASMVSWILKLRTCHRWDWVEVLEFPVSTSCVPKSPTRMCRQLTQFKKQQQQKKESENFILCFTSRWSICVTSLKSRTSLGGLWQMYRWLIASLVIDGRIVTGLEREQFGCPLLTFLLRIFKFCLKKSVSSFI